MYIYIKSMSESQSDIYRDIAPKSKLINSHIIKLLLFPNALERNHWIKEIYAFVWFVDKLKGKNKRPKPKFIKKCLSVSNDAIDALIWHAISEEDQLTPQEVSVDEAEYAVNAYQDWLAETLSAKGAVTLNQVREKLDEITQSCSDNFQKGGLK